MENSKDFYDRLLKDQLNEDEQLDIVSKDPPYNMHMYDTTIKVQEAAIRKDPNAIKYIHDQSDHIKMFAINQGCLLKYIKKPAYSMDVEAIKINCINIAYVRVQRTELLDYAIELGAIGKISKSLETNDCDKFKATLDVLYARQCVKYLEEDRLESRRHSFFNRYFL